MNREAKIDLFLLAELWLGNARRCWALGLILVLLGASALGWYGTAGEACYEAHVSVTATAQTGDPAAVMPGIFRSELLKRQVCAYLEVETIPAVSVSVLKDAGVYTLRVRHPDGEWSWRILEAMVECAPDLAGYTLGDVELTILTDSGIPDTPVDDGGAARWLMLGAGAGAALWIALVLAWTLLRQTVRTEEELGLDCLAVLPQKGALQQLSLTLRRLPEGRRTVLIAGALPGEGATALVEALAEELSSRGSRVLVWDCDPTAGTRWDGPDVRQGTPDGKALDEARKAYDFILLDAPPCALTAEGAKLSDLADFGLLVVRRDHAGRHQIREMAELLTEGGMELMGFVFRKT